jgi:hypothetical protein
MPKRSSGLAAGNNPLEVVQDPRVLSTGGGSLGAQLARKAILESNRNTFGWASKTTNGVRYYQSRTDAQGNVVPDTSKEAPNAVLNRTLLNLGLVLAGTLLIGFADTNNAAGAAKPDPDPNAINLEYFGLGVAASGAANVAATLFQIDL